MKIELKRAFKSEGMHLSLLIGMIISVSHIIRIQLPLCEEMKYITYQIPPILSQNWIGGDILGTETFLYFLILPILATLPYGLSYFEDKDNGFLKMIYQRTRREEYIKNKFVATFISGGIAVTVPLIINLMVAMSLFPNIVPDVSRCTDLIFSNRIFYQIYYSKPLVYITLFLIIDFLFAGMWAVIALLSSYLSDYKVVVLITPFFIQLILEVVWGQLNIPENSTIFFLQAGHGILADYWFIPIIYLLLGIIVVWIVFRRKCLQEDVF